MNKILLCFLIILIALSSAAQNEDFPAWAMFHSGRDKNKDTGNYAGFGEIKWKFKTNGKIFSSPSIAKGIAYTGSADGFVYAINIKTGNLKWKFKTNGAVHSSPAIYKGVAYFASFDGYCYALNAITGKQKWKFKTGGEKWMGGLSYWGMKPDSLYMDDFWDYFLSSPVMDITKESFTLYFGSSDKNLYALNATDGSLKWRFATNGIIHTTPAIHNGVIYFGNWDTYFYAVDAATGKEKWKFKTGGDMAMSGIEASATISNEKIYFGARDGFMYALNTSDGAIAWKYNAENSWIISSALIADDVLYVGTSDSYLLLALDANTGIEKWRYKTNGYVFSSPAIAGHVIYFGDFTGKMNAVDITTGKKADEFLTDGRKLNAERILKNDTLNFMHTANGADLSLYSVNKKVMDEFYKLGPIISSPAIQNGVIYFGSADGYLYALDLK